MLQDYIRKRSLFSSPMPPSMNLDLSKMDLAGEDQGQDYNSADVYSKLLSSPPPPAQAKYRDFLENQLPREEDYKPTKMSRVGAMLAGISDGVQYGGGKGYETARKVIEKPYDDALGDWKLQADKLAKASDLEEKDISNRVKTYRDIVGDQINQRNNTRAEKLDAARIADLNSRVTDRARGKLNVFTEPNTGKRVGVRIGESGTPERIELGVGVLTPEQQVDLDTKKATGRSNATLQNNLKLARERGNQARTTQAAKFKNIQELLKFKSEQPNMTIEHLSDGSIVLVDKNNNTIQDTGFNSGKLGDKEKTDLGIKLKASPGPVTPDKKVTTTVSDDGKSKTTTTTNSAGSTGKIKMTDPSGKAFMIDPKDEKDALAHGWKRVS